MIEHTYKELYNQDSVDKQFVIAYEDGEITNEDLYSESFELTESLCSQNELRFGSCEASMLKFKIANVVETLKNKWLTVSQVLAGKDDTPFQFGKYKVYSDVPSGDRNYRNITAYDSMYDIINADVAAWYESLVFPITQKEFRDSFFEYFGIEQVETELILDDMSIEKTISATSISGKDIITAICELNGVFGHINRRGVFEYISLPDKANVYPSIRLFPSNELFPVNNHEDYRYDRETLANGRYISCEYEDFNTSFITKLQIRQEENDIGAVVGDGTNTYIIEDNFLVYGKEPKELSEIASKIFDKIKLVQYRPMKATLRGNPCLEVGDAVVFHTRYKDVEGYILERTIKGIQSLRDTFESKGVYEYEEKVNSVQKEIKRLKGKTNVLERSVEETKSTITDVKKGLQSQISQNAGSIAAKVSKGDVSSQLSIELGKILLKGNRIAIESDYFKLSEDGSVEAKNGTFTGIFKQFNTNGFKSVEISGNEVAIYAWHENGDYVGSYGALRREESDGTVRSIVSLWCDYGDILSLNYNSPSDSNSKKAVITFDPEDMENGHTPWIKNTSSGTLFADNPNGGVVVENGLIKKWSLTGSNSTIFPDNPSGGITLKNGLVTSWNLTGATGTLYPNNPNGGVSVVNGLITDWSLTRIGDGTLNTITGVHTNAEGYVDGFRFTKVVIKDGIFISWSHETKYIAEGWIY